jgi:MoaA/NifB/PqqE/SkfB family radical SAM enzyme/GT2 family glycosyltransferase
MMRAMRKDKSPNRGLVCLHPFYFMEFTTDGQVYTCCPAWVKTGIGSIRENTIEEIWNGEKALFIRESMYAGEWQKICNPVCPILSSSRHNKGRIDYDALEEFDYLTAPLIAEIRERKVRLESSPTVFNLSNSKVCNLSCIMCVRDKQVDDPGLMHKTADDVMRHLPAARRLIMSGMGDPLARPDTRDLLIHFRGDNAELKIELITNGLLLPKYWERIKHQKFATILISVDAAAKETYEKIRRGGKWESLLESLQLVQRNINKFSGVGINMTVMRENYREIPAFIDLAESYGFSATFQRIRGECGNQNIFEMNDIEALDELKSIMIKEHAKERHKNVFWGDLLEFYTEGKRSPRVEDEEGGALPDKGENDNYHSCDFAADDPAAEWLRGTKYAAARELTSREGLPLSVVICTFNRAELLAKTLGSLVGQTLDKGQYEVIVIDDGSSDTTRECVESFTRILPVRYFFQKNAGLASARNHGIYTARGQIIFFMDDDDVASASLLEEHLATHRKFPGENYAVLNYTTWASDLTVTPLMHFIAEVGCFLFSYPYIKDGDVLDYTYFWGGRSSCKRSFLIEHGVFNPVFRFGCEDIELGYRLSHHGLKIIYNSRAVSYMNRAVGFDDFCGRLVKQGNSQYLFTMLHDDPGVQKWAEVSGASDTWEKIGPVYGAKLNTARGLDNIANARLKLNLGLDDLTLRLLHNSYWWAFRASKMKGIAEGREKCRRRARAT